MNGISFAPFGSDENRKGRGAEIAWAPEGDIPNPSPKSIYRLADKVSNIRSCVDANIDWDHFPQYGFPELKTLALNRIQRNLKSCDIVREVFSVFTSMYV